MVIPMKKYSFLIYHGEYEAVLKNLQELGVLHIVEKFTPTESEEMQELVRRAGRLDKAIRFLNTRKQEAVPSEGGDATMLLEQLAQFQTQYESQQQELHAIRKDILTMQPWGEFDPASIKRLKESGIDVTFCSVSAKKYDPAWLDEYSMEIINDKGAAVYFVVFGKENKSLPAGVDALSLPMLSLSKAGEREKQLLEVIAGVERSFDEYAARYTTLFEDALAGDKEEIHFEQVRMAAEGEVDGQVKHLEGWVPKTEEKALATFLEKAAIVSVEIEPEEGEVPPVLLKNGFFGRLFEPIGKLFSLPAYTELDLTSVFAPFFTLFFGLCLGDAGYGVIILLAATIAKFKVNKEYKPLLSLVQILGFSTVVIGVLTGTVFGVWLSQTGSAAVQKMILIPDSGKIFYIALAIGIVQILVGMVVQVVNRIRKGGFLAGVSTIGWILLVLGIVSAALTDMIPFLKTVPKLPLYLAAAGALLILFFNDMKVNVFVRVGKGLWELYGITGFAGDVLSYVRLFALGISSAILGLVVNNIGGQFQAIPIVGPVLFIIFLIIGHTGNLLLSGLGSFVHPMRLTFVEFYNNAGFEGGGKPYKPFAYSKKNKESV